MAGESKETGFCCLWTTLGNSCPGETTAEDCPLGGLWQVNGRMLSTALLSTGEQCNLRTYSSHLRRLAGYRPNVYLGSSTDIQQAPTDPTHNQTSTDIQHGQRHPAQIGSQRTKETSRRRQPQTITDILRRSTSTQSRPLRTGSLSEDPSAQDRVRSAIE